MVFSEADACSALGTGFDIQGWGMDPSLFLPPNLKGILLASALTFPKDFGILKDCKLEVI
ncbi:MULTISPECIES: hypothetical protein [Aerococcus]|uniref:Uncharacterized protein n=1 Tax=Aerococcus tenax TaxID=3078812 RepID=A0A5N1BR39_9LACT|nr:hypothetical protein [Aerococcus urinae]KAA9242648.1 hypothetical protein F6I34_00345 [Aerococcus urinae]MDK6370834.1 hypothetical protein [Aerococcus urinae]MDK6597205.1 hypothetical protein [Aerococcus urinae]MDK7301958.1 hypothetical protein [Aerococcus urinae]MDK7801091.1 hypothetical protein [Aerococcus urinae]